MSNFLKSFKHAFRGIILGVKKSRNLRIQIASAFYTLVLSPFFLRTRGEYAALFVIIFGVLSAELVNTAIEHICDKLDEGYNRTSKIVKDIAAGTVLFISLGSLCVAAVLFSRPDGFVNLWRFCISNLCYTFCILISLIPAFLFIIRKKKNKK